MFLGREEFNFLAVALTARLKLGRGLQNLCILRVFWELIKSPLYKLWNPQLHFRKRLRIRLCGAVLSAPHFALNFGIILVLLFTNVTMLDQMLKCVQACTVGSELIN